MMKLPVYRWIFHLLRFSALYDHPHIHMFQNYSRSSRDSILSLISFSSDLSRLFHASLSHISISKVHSGLHHGPSKHPPKIHYYHIPDPANKDIRADPNFTLSRSYYKLQPLLMYSFFQDSPLVPIGRNRRTDIILSAEDAVLEAGGCVLRLAGLYISFSTG